MGRSIPFADPELLAVFAVSVAFLSASQTSCSRYTPTSRSGRTGPGASIYFIGYRLAMLVAGTVAP